MVGLSGALLDAPQLVVGVDGEWMSCSCDASKAQRLLSWTPSVLAPELATIMVDGDIALECEGKPWIDKPSLAGWQ